MPHTQAVELTTSVPTNDPHFATPTRRPDRCRPLMRKADLSRILGALKAAGEIIRGVTVMPSGEVTILTGAPAPANEADSLIDWRAARAERPA